MKDVDLGEPTSFLDHVYLGRTQRECQISKDIVANYRDMFESWIFAGAKEKLPTRASVKLGAETPYSWSFDMEGHAKKCVERSCELAKISTQQLYKDATPCMDDHHFKEENESVGELSAVCLQDVLKCLYLARIGRLDIFWLVHRRLARLISYTHHTSEYRQYCFVGNTAQQCRLGLFQDSDFAGDFEDSQSTSGGALCIFGSHTFLPIRWMCKKQTSAFHSSEAEIISLDAGLCMDGIPALTLWDLVNEVFHSVLDRTDGPKTEPRRNPSLVVKLNMHNSIPTKHTNAIPTNIITFHQIQRILVPVLCCMSSRTTRQ